MLRHVVLFDFAPRTPEARIEEILRGFQELGGKIPGIRAVTTGRNTSPEGLDRGFRHGFVMDLDSAEARDAYLAHPDHVAFAERLVLPALSAGRDSIVVFDHEVADS